MVDIPKYPDCPVYWFGVTYFKNELMQLELEPSHPKSCPKFTSSVGNIEKTYDYFLAFSFVHHHRKMDWLICVNLMYVNYFQKVKTDSFLLNVYGKI